MDKTWQPAKYEEALYKFWEDKGFLKAGKGKPYTILMPPPNANASLHAGHGMYTVDDVAIRYRRLQGYASLWIPGLDHAGVETQYVYEKYLTKKSKSRFDFDRQTLYEDIAKFVKDNSGLIYKQFKRLGFLADWDRSVYTLDSLVLDRVFMTFEKMHKERLIYRDDYIVNYCTYCGTSLAELEVKYIERKDPLYYIKYGPFVLATVRPETKFGDTAIAVHPKDKRYNKRIGKEIEAEGLLGKFKLKVIGDEAVDPEFGTGVVKVTPAHDPNDYEMGKRHGLEVKQVIDITGRLTQLTGPYAGLKVKEARQKVTEDLKKAGLIEKIDQEYTHSVAVCYRCGRDLEPTIIPNWYVRVKNLKKPVIEAVKKDRVKFYPKSYKKQMLDWLEMMHDWPISRQIVWGIRIPVWYKVDPKASNIWVWWIDKNKKTQQGNVRQFLEKGISLGEIEEGLQKVHALVGPSGPKYIVSNEKPNNDYLPETDTFDTWFSSGQWPLVTLKEDEYSTRFPTDMMGTLADILRFWISRMIMFSLYLRNDVPFKDVYLWSMVADAKGVKMSKSKGNVINPIDLVDKYGADAFRATMFFGLAEGGKVNLAEDKVLGMRNFANKIWNVGRFLYLSKQNVILGSKATPGSADSGQARMTKKQNNKIIQQLNKEFKQVIKSYHKYMERYQFAKALEVVYEFLWHRFADYYIEQLKDELKNDKIEAQQLLMTVYFENLKMLHPFMPFVTEAIYKIFHGEQRSILNDQTNLPA